MKSIVRYEERGTGGKNQYRGNSSPKLIEDLIDQFKPKSISDYMAGSFTTQDVAIKMGIGSRCYDLNMGFDLMNDPIKERNDMIFHHPPYWDIIKYSKFMYGEKIHPSDTSHIVDYKEFMAITNELVLKQFASLKTGGRMAILVGDIKKKGQLYSMILDLIKPGTLESLVIKEQFNTWSERKIYSNNNFIPIIHEYLLILKRVDQVLMNLKITKDYDFDIRDSKTLSWKEIIASVIEDKKKPMTIDELLSNVENHKKAKNNHHIRAKIRQVLNTYNIFKKIDNTYTLSYL